MGLFSAIGNLITSRKQKKMAKKINPIQTTYQTAAPIQKLYQEGQNLYQGRMAGVGQAEQNLLTEGANFRAGVDQSATSGAQALALKAAGLGSTNQAFQDLAVKEAQDKQARFGINSQVSQLMAREGDKVYQDELRKYYDDLNYKRGLEGASMQNKQNFFGGLDDMVNTAASIFTGGFGGGGNGLFGAKPKANQQSANYNTYL